MKKKGVSTVVATVLIVLLTISAFAILSQTLIPFVRDELFRAGECKNYDVYFDFEETIDNGTGIYNYNCYEKSGNTLIGFSISGIAEFKENFDNVEGFLIFMKKEGGTKSFNVTRGKLASLEEEGIWVLGEPSLSLYLPKPNEIITYVYNSTSEYNEAAVHTIMPSGRVCGKSNSIKLSRCTGVSLK